MNIHEEAAREQARLTAEYLSEMIRRSIGDDILTLEQAADLLKFHPTTVSGWAKQGKIPGKKIGDSWRFCRSELLDHVRGKRNQP